MTIAETMVMTALVGVVGLVVFSLLHIGTILGAKNIAVNTAHQQARVAMLQMVQDLHSSVSLPALADRNGDPPAAPSPGAIPSPTPDPTPAPGIAFQLLASGPHKIAANAAADQNEVVIVIANGTPRPVQGQRLIVRTHGIEETITAVNGPLSALRLTLARNISVPINITASPTNHNIVCLITERCSYAVVDGTLIWKGPTVRNSFARLGNGITSEFPFNTPTTPMGAPYQRFVAAIDLSTSDTAYSARKFKAANILLNGMVPMRARLTDTQ